MSGFVNTTINGMNISFDGEKLTIGGLNKSNHSCSKSSPINITKDGRIEGDVEGNIQIVGNNVTLIIQGDVTGNIVGAASVSVQGDITGNITAQRVNRG